MIKNAYGSNWSRGTSCWFPLTFLRELFCFLVVESTCDVLVKRSRSLMGACAHLAGGSQQRTILFPAQTLQLVSMLLQNWTHDTASSSLSSITDLNTTLVLRSGQQNEGTHEKLCNVAWAQNTSWMEECRLQVWTFRGEHSVHRPACEAFATCGQMALYF